MKDLISKDGSVHVLGHNVATVHHAARHVPARHVQSMKTRTTFQMLFHDMKRKSKNMKQS